MISNMILYFLKEINDVNDSIYSENIFLSTQTPLFFTEGCFGPKRLISLI